ncbi:class I SAM-dependent methyltransferase [Niallia sp. NCCP-28]|uniref:class I SAM-dependent methyltransferase n=1 Tax=Niallia sp. NCCP-28 TaxID=2934712 RepID=UPI00208C0E81|nr:class I SAM-dependent methyltransferase [Niallia sp. NCCP-28]GKU84476.1 methyltransferase [Niallia sp. NCCP-28]
MKEKDYEKLLHINTEGYQQGFHKSLHYHRYEPTPYKYLEVLFSEYTLKSSDHVVDFGCGKGRLNFFIHYFFQATVTGVEFNELYYQDALKNRINYSYKGKNSMGEIRFELCKAEEYEIAPLDNRFYFFNPFSIQIFIKIINNILYSLERNKRDIEIILYYPSDEYCLYLNNHPYFSVKQEIQLSKTRQSDREKFLIYQGEN